MLSRGSEASRSEIWPESPSHFTSAVSNGHQE